MSQPCKASPLVRARRARISVGRSLWRWRAMAPRSSQALVRADRLASRPSCAEIEAWVGKAGSAAMETYRIPKFRCAWATRPQGVRPASIHGEQRGAQTVRPLFLEFYEAWREIWHRRSMAAF